MKNIKSMIIGFLLATCMFLFMGATGNDSNDSDFERYQISTTWNNFQSYNLVMETIIDTKTGW